MRIEPSHGRAPSRATLTIAIILVLAVWAVNFLVVKIGLNYLPAVTFASFRVVAAALFMLVLAPLCRLLPIFRDSSNGQQLNQRENVIPLALSLEGSDARDLFCPGVFSSPTGAAPLGCKGAGLDSNSPHEPAIEQKIVIPNPPRVRDLLSRSPLATSHSPLLHHLWTFAYLGFFGVSINQVCFTIGLHYTSVTHSSIIVGMAPIYTLGLAVLLRLEKATWRKATGMAIAFLGVAILASSTGMTHHSPTLLGDAITMCGSLGFAMYVVLGKRVAGIYDAITMTTWNFVFGGLFLLPVAIQQAIKFGLLQHWREIPWQAWACIFYTGLFSSTLAYLFYFWLLRYLEASQLASFSYLLPVSASALGIVFLGERGSWLELLGGALALAGVYWIESTRNQ